MRSEESDQFYDHSEYEDDYEDEWNEIEEDFCPNESCDTRLIARIRYEIALICNWLLRKVVASHGKHTRDQVVLVVFLSGDREQLDQQ